MGIYLNHGNDKFARAINSEIYVDKTMLIEYTNKRLNTMQQNICISRPRRFGKSTTVDMLEAYYSRGCDSEKMFENYKIAKCESFKKHLNQYDVIALNMQEFLSRSKSMDDMLSRIKKLVMRDIKKAYPDVDYFDDTDLTESMKEVYEETKRPFIIIIDEWDCVFREYREHREEQNEYLDFLRDLLKDKDYIHLAYMTGILPIKKYGTHSALNMFNEFSMTNPDILAEFVGFTEQEVEELCRKYDRNPEELKEWYNGYHFIKEKSIYNPRSVVQAVLSGICDTYWNRTETFEALRMYIDMNFEGLKDDVLRMMAGESVPVNTGSFTNDMVTLNNKDDVLTLLIHLGYLGYDFDHECVFIPNNEIKKEFAARNFYTVYRELPTGKGFADMVYLPRKKFPEKPALVVELKWDKSAKGAITQIKEKQYCKSLEEYEGNLLLVGVNYDKDTREHSCVIEDYRMGE